MRLRQRLRQLQQRQQLQEVQQRRQQQQQLRQQLQEVHQRLLQVYQDLQNLDGEEIIVCVRQIFPLSDKFAIRTILSIWILSTFTKFTNRSTKLATT